MDDAARLRQSNNARWTPFAQAASDYAKRSKASTSQQFSPKRSAEPPPKRIICNKRQQTALFLETTRDGHH